MDDGGCLSGIVTRRRKWESGSATARLLGGPTASRSRWWIFNPEKHAGPAVGRAITDEGGRALAAPSMSATPKAVPGGSSPELAHFGQVRRAGERAKGTIQD